MPNPRFHPFVRLLLCALALFISVLLCSTLVYILMVATGQISSAAVMVSPAQIPPRFLLALMATQPFALLFAVVLCRRFLDVRSFASLGVRSRNVPQFFSGAFCGFLAIAFLFGLLWISGNVHIAGLSERALEIGPSGIALRLLFWALVMLGVGLSEEIVFRGYALHNLSAWLGLDKVGLGAAAIIQAVLFALIHMGNFAQSPTPEKMASAWQAMPNIFLIGLFLALCALKTGSLWFPIGFHAAWNFFLGSVFSLPVSGLATFRLLQTEVSDARWLTGGAFGAEGSVLLTVLIIVMIYMVRQAPDHAQFIGDMAALRPAEEPDEIEVASRAPDLRERKELRRAQTQTTSGFEGWNDLAPPQRQRYTTYQPQQIESSQPAAPAAATAPQATFPESAFAENAPLETVSPVAPPATTPNDFAAYRPPTPAPAPITQTPPDFNELVLPVAESKSETPVAETPAAIPETPVKTVPEAPPTPPIKKPPAPRW